MGLDAANIVVELGPGTGIFTRFIERELKPEARLICLEINPELARTVAEQFPRALVVNDSAENLAQHLGHPDPGVDCVISGLPWVILSEGDQKRLLEPAVNALRPGGRFATFAYSHASWLPAGRRFRAMLESSFSRVDVSAQVWRNLPAGFRLPLPQVGGRQRGAFLEDQRKARQTRPPMVTPRNAPARMSVRKCMRRTRREAATLMATKVMAGSRAGCMLERTVPMANAFIVCPDGKEKLSKAERSAFTN